MAKKKVFLDPGHGGSDPGAVANGLQEKNLTLAIAKECEKVLKSEYDDVDIKLSRTGDTYPSLSARAKMANDWGANLFISVHINADGGTGFESFVYNGVVAAATITYQNAIHATIISGSGFKDRGKKRANFQVLRDTKMPAVLTENGFIDRREDAEKLKDPAFIKKLGRLHAEGIAKALGLKKKKSSGGSSGGSKNDGPFDQFKPEELPAAPNGAKFTRTLKLKSPMMQGKDVEAVQAHAYIKKYLKGAVDGIFGPDTKQAIEKYQEEHGIQVTGEIGDWNWNYLFKKKEEPKPETKTEYHRVYVDGKQVASFKEGANVIDKVKTEVENALKADKKALEIRIERVLL